MSHEMPKGWVGVDLDGTLATYDHWRGVEHIGEPIPEMLDRVKAWLARGVEVRVFTARIHGGRDGVSDHIRRWCAKHIGVELPVTNVKDFDMIELWDDRAVSMETNSDRVLGGASRIDEKYPPVRS